MSIPDIVGVAGSYCGTNGMFRFGVVQYGVIAKVFNEIRQELAGFTGIRQVAARRWHAAARLLDMSDRGARFIGKVICIRWDGQTRHSWLL